LVYYIYDQKHPFGHFPSISKEIEMTQTGPDLDTPATYRIRVSGYLDNSWSDRLGGLTITPKSQGDDFTETTLYGQVIDQAALAGVLSALYDLHLPLLSVEYLG
jgi:hypothetical protein